MKNVFVLCFYFFIFSQILASPQSSDYLILDKDTIPIFSLPLYQLPDTEIEKFYDNVRVYEESGEIPIKFSLWRGYSLLWELLDSKLYLISVINNKNSDDILKKSFPDKYEKGRVFADWFNGTFSKAKGELLRWDGVFSRTYVKEDIIIIENGVLSNISEVDNYIYVPNGISRINNENPYEGYPKTITDTIFKEIKKLDWEKLSNLNDCGCDDKYIIEINEYGKIDKVEYLSLIDEDKEVERSEDIIKHKECIEIFKEQLKNLQFDIIKWNGYPYREKIWLNFFYTIEDELENWSN